jgi:biopolymer transport protein ExbB/TolQ
MISAAAMVLGYFAQAGAPAQQGAENGAAATDAAGAVPPVLPDEAAREAERAAALAEQAEQSGQSELSLWTVIQELEFFEQAVMVILLACFVYAMALMFEKFYVMRKTAGQTKDFLAAFRKAQSVEEAEQVVRKQPVSGIKTMFDAGMAEVRKTQDLGLYTMRDARDHTMQRVAAAMTSKQNENLEQLGSSMTFLASIGANAPFIGLLGTVWGILVAFLRIAETQTTSLAAVASPIAGALMATAAGLAAAIPAVLIYNFTAKQISKQGGKLDDFAAEFIALVSRDMDRRGA